MTWRDKYLNQIVCGDCLELMTELPDKSIDLVITDPPYLVSRESNFGTMPDRTNPRTGTDLGSWDRDFDNSGLIGGIGRKLKDGGSLIIFNDFRKATTILTFCEGYGLVYKDTLLWEKTNPMPRNRDRRYVPNVEMLAWYVKPGTWTFNRQNDNYEGCVFRLPSESGGAFKRYHPAQKPLSLIKQLITIHSNEGDLVFDPTVGSGTTALAAKTLNRNFIGIDIDSKYCETARKRLAQECLL